MPDLPALPLGRPETRQRITRQTPRPTLKGPGPARQLQRLGDSLDRLTKSFEAGKSAVTEQPAATSEQVLVLEIAGEITDFVKAVRRVPGLEFLAEEAQDRAASDSEFKAVDNKGKAHRYDRQLYLVISDASAWEQLLGLWNDFQNGKPMKRGFAPFAHLFGRLRTLRAWNDQDRLERSGALDAWSKELADLHDELVEFEIELFLRRDTARQESEIADLRAKLELAGGSIISTSVRPEIDYHGVLARVPAHRLQEAVATHEMRWLRTASIRFFHAVGQLASEAGDDALADPANDATDHPAGDPRIAVLDGVPLAGHKLLAGRIILDDPDGWEELSPANRRRHGTGISSLVVHGDLQLAGEPQKAPVYVRPILWDQAPIWLDRGGREEMPRDRLAVDVLHSAIVRLFEGEAVAPHVKVIVLAIGDAVCQFDRFVSPLARLLDWLSSRFEVLLLVAAGNHLDDLELVAGADLANPEELQHEILCALQRDSGMRRLLSPAESINALTIGAAHSDAAPFDTADGRLDPVLTPDLPNVSSAAGAGIRRSVKPDVLLPGGRQMLVREPSNPNDTGQILSVSLSQRPPGVRVATPGRQPGQLDATRFDSGTSVATAQTGYHAGHLIDSFDALRERYGNAIAPSEFDAVLTKAAVAHAARWGSASTVIDPASEDVLGQKSRGAVARMVGYGHSRPADVLRCDDHRATALAANRLTDGIAHTYRFPLPPSLASSTTHRRLIITLAWLTPINASHRAYRRAALALEPLGLPKAFGERFGVGLYDGRRGTLQHEVLEGQRAVPYAPDKTIDLVVSCRADAGELSGSVPYAVFVTLEVPSGINVPVYQEVRQRLTQAVAIRPTVSGP